MSVRSIAAVGTAVLALFVTGQALADTEDTTAPDTMAEQLQTRGAYVARAAGCRACHSGEARDYAGGKVIETPFGNLASANITPDPETGIGGWTLADFDRALRQGHNREGEPLYPAMPYMHYTKMTDEDLGLLWDYIQSLEPVRNEVDVNRLPFPYSIRASVNVWQGLYFEEGRFEPDPEESDTWNRGAYLVQAMAHCGSCHTPRDALGGPKKDQFLQGRQLGSYYAPDISGGPGSVIGDRSVEELTAFLHGNGENNHVALSDMRQVTSDLSSLREDDVRAIATYIKSLGDSEAPVEQTVAEIDSESMERGASVYAIHCKTCHQEDGTGREGVASSLVNGGAVEAASPNNIIATLLQGIGPGTGPYAEYGVMPSFREVLSDQEIADVTNYVRQSWGNDAPTNATEGRVSGLRAVTETAELASAAASCGNVPEDAVGDSFRRRIQDLASARELDPEAVATLGEEFAEANPDTANANRVAWLSGLYCQQVASSGAPTATVIEQHLTFMNAL